MYYAPKILPVTQMDVCFALLTCYHYEVRTPDWHY